MRNEMTHINSCGFTCLLDPVPKLPSYIHVFILSQTFSCLKFVSNKLIKTWMGHFKSSKACQSVYHPKCCKCFQVKHLQGILRYC